MGQIGGVSPRFFISTVFFCRRLPRLYEFREGCVSLRVKGYKVCLFRNCHPPFSLLESVIIFYFMSNPLFRL